MHRLRPDVAIALDVTYATDVPGADARARAAHHVPRRRPGDLPRPARQPARVRAAAGRGSTRRGSTHTVEVGRRPYSDADVTFASREGIPTGLVSIPLRNMHSPIEIVQLDDLEACIRLLVAFARKLEPGATYAR